MSRKTIAFVSTLAASAITSALACYSGGAPQQQQPPPVAVGDGGPMPFQADTAAVYVAKVKNLLVGLPPTDDEVKKVTADPTQLGALVDGWMKLPQYQQKMMVFFELAFQQTQIGAVDFVDQFFPQAIAVNQTSTPLIVQNMRESFARTVLQLMSEGAPFSDTITTRRFMMTPAMMEAYAYLDAWHVDDAGKIVDRFAIANPALKITIGAAAGPVPIAQTLDPMSPNFMHWYDPDVPLAASRPQSDCGADPFVEPVSARYLHMLLYGTIETHKGPNGGSCPQFGGSAMAPQFAPTDFNTWKMVTIRAPGAGEKPSTFYDLPALRAASELLLVVPRVGFFSTPAFFANWQTNTSNQMRVTMNQTLIVATGSAVDGTDPTVPTSTPGIDPAHTAPNTPCFGCHQTLDPLRSMLSATYTWNYHDQNDMALMGQKGLFAYRGVIQPVSNIDEFAKLLSTHPLFPQAWAQKLCYYLNSAACVTTDPEFQRVVGVFQSNNYSWNALVREMVTSPLTTNATETQTAATNGEVVAVARRDHLCAALNARLGFTDVCGLDVMNKQMAQSTIPEIVSGLPSDGYGRGSPVPILPNKPSLFYRAATENICEAVAAQVIDVGGNAPANVKHWSSSQPDTAISDFVQIVMALTPSDPRSAPATTLLRAHFDAAMKTGASASDSLKSTFTTACLAPSAVGIGM